MYVKESLLPLKKVSPNEIKIEKIDLIVYSNDRFVHKIIIPTNIDYKVEKIRATYFLIKNNVTIMCEESTFNLSTGSIELIVPEKINGYDGKINLEIDVYINDSNCFTFARYSFLGKRTLVDNINIESLDIFYYKKFECMIDKMNQYVNDVKNQSIESSNKIKKEQERFYLSNNINVDRLKELMYDYDNGFLGNSDVSLEIIGKVN